jgi:protein-disulfide isomerase
MTRPAILLALALGAATVLAPAASAAPASQSAGKPAARVDWSAQVRPTPEGGFVMGNPFAPVKLVEYGSLTCGHCAHFAHQAMAPLMQNYVRNGVVSFEYRNFILNGLDVAASLVARCGGAATFFPMADKLYANQETWMGRVSALTDAQKAKLNALPEAERLAHIAETVGLTALAAEHGIAPAQAKRCLSDQAALEELSRMAEAASNIGVQGTPTFFLNGTNIGPHDWSTLEPILREAAG